MGFGGFFKERKHRNDLLAQAIAKSDALITQRKSLDDERTLKLKRQVELWSIMNLDSESEEEYFHVSHRIADLIKQIAAIDEYLEDLHAARKTCTDTKECVNLEHLLAVQDPWQEKVKQGKQDAVPRVAV